MVIALVVAAVDQLFAVVIPRTWRAAPKGVVWLQNKLRFKVIDGRAPPRVEPAD